MSGAKDQELIILAVSCKFPNPLQLADSETLLCVGNCHYHPLLLHAYRRRPEVDGGGSFHIALTSLFKTGSLTEPGAL